MRSAGRKNYEGRRSALRDEGRDRPLQQRRGTISPARQRPAKQVPEGSWIGRTLSSRNATTILSRGRAIWLSLRGRSRGVGPARPCWARSGRGEAPSSAACSCRRGAPRSRRRRLQFAQARGHPADIRGHGQGGEVVRREVPQRGKNPPAPPPPRRAGSTSAWPAWRSPRRSLRARTTGADRPKPRGPDRPRRRQPERTSRATAPLSWCCRCS